MFDLRRRKSGKLSSGDANNKGQDKATKPRSKRSSGTSEKRESIAGKRETSPAPRRRSRRLASQEPEDVVACSSASVLEARKDESGQGRLFMIFFQFPNVYMLLEL